MIHCHCVGFCYGVSLVSGETSAEQERKKTDGISDRHRDKPKVFIGADAVTSAGVVGVAITSLGLLRVR